MFISKNKRSHSFFLFCSIALLVIFHNGSRVYAQGPNVWTQKTNYGGVSRDGAFAFSLGSLGYIGGGNNNGSFKNDLWEYNPTTNAWTQKANVPSNEYLASSFTIGSKAYVGCGYNTGNAFYEYDGTANAWTAKASMPGTARYITMGFSIGTKGYCGTGYNPNNPYNSFSDFYEFDPVANTWTAKASMPGGNRSYAVGFSIGSRGYAGTGNINGNAVRDFYEYDPAGDVWTAKANIGTINRLQSFGIALNGKGYVGGGGQGNDPNGFYEYDATTNTWTAKANIPVSRAGAVGFAIGSKLYIGTGGDPFDNNYSSSTYYYRKDFYEWSSCGPIITVSPASAFLCGSGTVTLTASGASTYTWSNGITNGGTVNPSATTTYTVTGALSGTCAATSNAVVTVVVNNAPVNQSISAATTSFACNGKTNINLSTQAGVNYYLRNDANNAIIVGPVSGTGGTINIPTGNMATTTTLNINAKSVSGGLLFDGVDDDLRTQTGGAFNFASDFSVETWINAPLGSNPGTRVIIGQPGSTDLWLGLDNGGYPNFTIGGGTTTGTFVVNDGKWHHLAAVRQSGNKYLYVDGILVASGLNSSTLSAGGDLEIGAYTGAYNFKGSIDEVKIWNTARTQVQVVADMTACATGVQSGLVLYYNFEEASGNKTTNLSGTLSGGTLVNMVSSAWSYGVEACVACAAVQMTTKPVITVGPITNQTLTAVNPNICVSGTGTVTTSGSEKNLDYFLRDNSNNAVVMGPVDGTGSALSFTTGLISTNKTYNVYAKSQTAFLDFDGVDDYVASTSTVGIPAGNDNYTIEALIKPDPANPSGSIITWGNYGTANEVTGLRLDGTGRLLHYWWANDLPVTAGNLADGAWHHVAATYDGTTRSVYVDGILVGSDNATGHNNTNATNLKLGGYFFSGPFVEVYKGGMDEVRIWNVARTAAEIAGNMSNSLTGSESGLSVYYKFTDGPGSATVKDYAGGNNPGTLTNMNTATAWQYDSAPCTLQMSTTPAFTVNALPVVSAAGIAICAGATGTITPSGASTYTISGGSFAVSPSANTSYSITGTSAAGCVSSNTAVTTITVNVLPLVTANVTNSVICSGATTTLNGGGATTYTWTPGVTNNVSFAPTATAAYTVTGTDANGCMNTASKTITVNALPSVAANTTNSVVCRGASVTLSGVGATTYTWTSGLSDNVAFTPTNTTTYTVTGTDANGCMNSAVRTITVNALPVLTVNNGTICAGNSFTISPTGATTYTFSGGNTVVSPTANTSYSVSGTDNNGCVSAMAISSVSVNSLPVVTVNSGSVCSGTSFTMTPAGAISYTYSAGSQVVTPSATTSYSVTGTGSNGCVSLPATANVTVTALPLVSINSGSVCSGESFTLVPAGAVTYTLSGGSTIVSPTASTSYTVTGTDGNGCISLPAVSNLTVNSLPSVTVNSGTICIGNTFTLMANGAATYTVTGGSYTVSPTSNSTYTVTGTSIEGCEGSAVSTVSVQSALTMNIAGSGTVCAGQSLSLTANGASTYSWNTGATTNSITATPVVNTTYSVSGLSGACTGTAMITVTVNALPSVSATSSSSAICVGNTVILTGAGANSYTWSTGAQTTSISVSPTVTTQYTVTGKDVAGCSNTASLSQVVNTCTAIETLNGTAHVINVYPNPSAGEFTLELYAAAQISILDVLGKAVYTQALADGKHNIDLKEQAAGLYILKVSIAGKTQTVRLIKQ